jgi:hypothetical protein
MKYATASNPLLIKYESKWYIPFQVYTKPWALSMGGWMLLKNQIKKKHPIQYFFREALPIKYWAWKMKVSDVLWKIENRFKNPRKEMRGAVFPSEYRDLPEIVFSFNSEVIKEIYEREKYFDQCFLSPAKSKRRQFEKDLKKYYKYITVDRKNMNAEADELFKVKFDAFSSDPVEKNCEKKYRKWIKKIDLIKKSDDQMCVWVSYNREYFWT